LFNWLWYWLNFKFDWLQNYHVHGEFENWVVCYCYCYWL
jgi:hypothetical protein